MKNATLIIAAVVLGSLGTLRAEEGIKDQGTSFDVAFAGELPMTRPMPSSPVQMLPGMSAASHAPALPQAVITDLTNAPNPFDSRKPGIEGKTQISYQLMKDSKVTVEIYSLLGTKVRGWSFAPGDNGARKGLNAFLWDGTNEQGQKVAKGGYLAEIVVETPETTATVVRKIGLIH